MPILIGDVKLVNANFSWQLQSGIGSTVCP